MIEHRPIARTLRLTQPIALANASGPQNVCDLVAWRRLVLFASVLTLAACSSVQATRPAGFDLTGRWRLDPTQSDVAPAGDREVDLEQAVGRPRTLPFRPTDFPLLIAEELVIEQDQQSMGIEYTGLTYRDVSFGERKWSGWKITAGWNELGELEVRMQRGPVRYQESYALAPDGNQLVIRAVVDTQRGERAVARVFERVPDLPPLR
jgi:hypothetical protein